MSVAAGAGSEVFHLTAGPAPFSMFIDEVPDGGVFGDVPWNNLGIQLDFLLSPGDQVNLGGRINVTLVPLPPALPLLLPAVAGLAALRRRR